MKVLAFDSALGACSVALWEDGATLACQSETMMRGQAEKLVPMIRDVLEAGARDPDLLAVTVGPGTFTGIRIGLAAARGFALARGLPIVGVTTTAGLAASTPDSDGLLLVVVDSKRDEVFAEYFGIGSTNADNADGPVALLPQDLPAYLRRCGHDGNGPLRLVGDAIDTARVSLENVDLGGGIALDIRSDDPRTPDPSAIASVAAADVARNGIPARPPVPLYIKRPDVSAPEKDRARRPYVR